MRSAPLLIACLVACADPAPELPGAPEGPSGPASPGTTDPGPSQPYLEGKFTDVLAARARPEIVLPARPVTRIGRCAVELGPRPATASTQLRAELVARDGAGWDAQADFDPWGGGVLRAVIAPDGAAGSPRVSLDDDEAVATVVPFIVANYDLFGLAHDDVATARIRVGIEGALPGTLVARTIALRGREPVASTDAPAWDGEIDLGWDGHVRAMIVHSEALLPDVALCDAPGLPASDARVVASILGYQLSYSDMTGEHAAGVVAASDLGAIALVKRREPDPLAGSTVIRLVYRVSVEHRGLRWAFDVDPDSGAIVAVEQGFIVG